MNTVNYDEAAIEKDIEKIRGPCRLQGEDFETYKQRRKVENFLKNVWMKGFVFWDSGKLGTYHKPKWDK